MLYDQIQEAIHFIRAKTNFRPDFGIILGTGLGGLTDDIEVVSEFDYKDIPHFPVSTVPSHNGKLLLGTLAGKAVVAMAGRFHYYEGYSMQQVTFPVRVLKSLGIERILISNVSGSVNAQIEAGDIVFVKDHINLQPENPLLGPNDDRLGLRFPDMYRTYDGEMLTQAKKIAADQGIHAHEGVYVALEGPSLETPAEYGFLHRIGGDLVGMSTIPEVIVAKHAGLKIFVISVVSNKCYPLEEITKTTIESVIALAEAAEPKMRLIVKELVKHF